MNTRIPESLASCTTLAQYLLSRSVAGMNAQELISNIETASDNQVTGRFFPFYPPRDVNLTPWLANWMRKGAVPVSLLNLQRTPLWGFVPDAWHHQMIYACDLDGIYLMNPIERKSIENIMNELTSDSVLLVRSTDIVKRFTANNANLHELLSLRALDGEERKRWLDMNVLGQVLNVLRELNANDSKQDADTTLENQDHGSNRNNSLLANSFHLDAAHEFNNAQDESNEGQRRHNHFRAHHHISNQDEMLSNQHDANAGGHIMQSLSSHSLSSLINLAESLTMPTNNGNQTTTTSASSSISNSSSISHVSIPASYVPGITLFAYRDSDLYKEISLADDLKPLKN